QKELGTREGKGLLYLGYGYKNIVSNFHLAGENAYDHIDLSFVGKGTNTSDLPENLSYFSQYLKSHPDIKTVADLGCGASPLLFQLAKKFPNIHFIGVDINDKNIHIAKTVAKNHGIENIEYYEKNVLHIDQLGKRNIDAIIGCYIFHQFHIPDLEKIIGNMKKLFGTRYILLKEALYDPENKKDLYQASQFFPTYYLYHVLTKQNLYSGDIWKRVLGKYGYSLQNEASTHGKIFTYLEFVKDEK
ncbi:class I SAM-dependent methyltransferase, partial [Candidatus Gracilibacteria bacterium]|nr:class I SAM-dependent methyltransferase [Candidatus Gracilibacteria bacterium]